MSAMPIPIPTIPMLSKGGSGKVLMVIGVLVAIAMISSAAKKAGPLGTATTS